MRIWVLSDLHIELTSGWDLPAPADRPDFDVLVMAGDLIPGMERGVEHGLHERCVLTRRLGRREVHLEHAWIRRDRELVQLGTRRRPVAFEEHRQAQLLADGIDLPDEGEESRNALNRRQEYAQGAVARLHAERGSDRKPLRSCPLDGLLLGGGRLLAPRIGRGGRAAWR